MSVFRPPKEDFGWVRYRIVKPEDFKRSVRCVVPPSLVPTVLQNLDGHFWMSTRLAHFGRCTLLRFNVDWDVVLTRGEFVRWRWATWLSWAWTHVWGKLR